MLEKIAIAPGPPCELEPRTLYTLRLIWWGERKEGRTMPAQRDVIVIDGGRADSATWTPEG